MTDAVYTYDRELFTNTAAQAKCRLHCLELPARGIGLYEKLNKTEFMCFNPDGIISINGRPLKWFFLLPRNTQRIFSKRSEEEMGNKWQPFSYFIYLMDIAMYHLTWRSIKRGYSDVSINGKFAEIMVWNRKFIRLPLPSDLIWKRYIVRGPAGTDTYAWPS